jgi:O-antigen ligase
MNTIPNLSPGNVQPRHPAKPAGRIRDKAPSFLLGALIWFSIFYWTIPPDILVPPDEKQVVALVYSDGNPAARTVKLILLVAGLIIIIQRSRQTRLLLRHTNRYFLLFLALVPLSYLWSISPADTLARFVSVLTIASISVAFCLVGWHQQRLQSVVRPALSLLLLGSIALYFYNPDLAIEHGEGTLHNSWHGLTDQKNTFGQISSFGAIFWLHAALSKQVNIIVALGAFALSMTCVFLSHSSTSLLASVFACGFIVLLLWSPKYLRRYIPYIATTFAIIVVLYAVTILKLVPGLDALLTPVMHLTGKDMTFSNRSEIWRIVKDHIQLSPLKGSGYGAYWIGVVPSSPSYRMLQELYFYPFESHNGYLEITNDLGFIGLTVLLGYLITFVRQSLQVMRSDRAQGALFLGLFFHQAIENLSESTWLALNSGTTFTLMVLATMALGRCVLEQRTAARGAPGPSRPRPGGSLHAQNPRVPGR